MAIIQKEEEIDLSNGEWIGDGGFGDVYKFPDGNGAFVLKIPKYTKSANKRKEQSEAFTKECQKLAEIKHANVVKYFGIVDVKTDLLGIKMEFCEFGTLKKLIFNPTIIYSMTDISIWAEQLFGALTFIFDEHNIVHRDIKAENIFVSTNFSLKLGDFGSLRESDTTCTGTFIGTLRYMSPVTFDPKDSKEEPQKVSHKNDVYSMGLVLWELIERRVVLSEFDAYEGGFDRDFFIWKIVFGNLSQVEGPTCSGPMGDIVQKCTRFQRRKRPEASDILKEIKALTQANGDLNQVTPIKDPNENRLIRPIGFNGGTDRQPIDAPLHHESSQDARMAEGAEIMEKYRVESWKSGWKERVDSFVHKFNSLNSEERSKFVNNIPNLIAKTLENKKIHFHEALSHLTRLIVDDTRTNHPLEDLFQMIIELKQRHTECDIAQQLDYLWKFLHHIPNLIPKALENKRIHLHEAWSHLLRLSRDDSWTNHPLEDLFQVIIEFQQRDTECDIARQFVSYIDPNKLPLIKFFEYSRLIVRLEELGSRLRSTTFYFRAFLSTETLQVWLLLWDVQSGAIFVRNDFQLVVRKGKWMNKEKSECRVGEDDLHYLEDQEIDFHQMLKKIKKQEKLALFQTRIFLNQLVPLDKSQERTESISVSNIGSGLEVKNYFFQLRNPPRMDCRHHPKCSILKYDWPEELKEMGIPYYSCSSDGSLQYYLLKWWEFCRSYLSVIFSLSPSDEGKITAYSLIFIQFKCDNQYYTLLDHPNNYEDHELIYYYDETMELHKMESSKIRKLLEEMAPKMRRYALVTRHIIFAIDQEGNRLPWSVSK